MNTQEAPQWLPSFAIPFFTLSYPTDPPATPDSFPNSSYYQAGLLDGCFIITCIAVMAILRDLLRLNVFEPFAAWKLKKDLIRQRGSPTPLTNGPAKENGAANGVANEDTKEPTNGHTNGNGNGHLVQVSPALVLTPKEARRLHRSVLRFAEQGWSVVYYTCQWLFGFVRIHCISFTKFSSQPRFIVRPSKPSDTSSRPQRRLDKLSPYTPCWSTQVLLSHTNRFLSSPNVDP